ncbi:MAG TPA: trypsin-like peptidase domain-containing protein, partial [Planctomycetota bacterium]|nr:trypsin-like peptidase domain-containing protein [Planctomycetota bacterium]
MPLLPMAASERGSARWPFFAAVFLGAAFAWGLSRRGTASLLDPSSVALPVEPRADLTSVEKNNVEIFKRVSPAVVFITTTGYAMGWGSNVVEVPEGSGSGFVWDPEGYVVTNFHVVANVAERRGKAQVLLSGERRPYDAEIVGVEE